MVEGMQVGAVYPQAEVAGDPTAVKWIGRAVEELGFDHLLAYEHMLGAERADRARRLPVHIPNATRSTTRL
jgi:hypothetical protein